jgi:hypothetical protein
MKTILVKPNLASLIHALILIGLGTWGYFGSRSPSVTALIPVAAGAALMFLNRGLKNENKVQAHVAVALTLLVLIALLKPLTGSIHRSDTSALARVLIMIVATIYALACFIRSFILARKNRDE